MCLGFTTLGVLSALPPKSFCRSIAGAPPSSSGSRSGSPSSFIIGRSEFSSSIFAISSSIPERSSPEMPSLLIISPSILSRGSPSSFAHDMQTPSFFFSPPSSFVMNITAILLWHLEHITIVCLLYRWGCVLSFSIFSLPTFA